VDRRHQNIPASWNWKKNPELSHVRVWNSHFERSNRAVNRKRAKEGDNKEMADQTRLPKCAANAGESHDVFMTNNCGDVNGRLPKRRE
jgi:hypothetical protein